MTTNRITMGMAQFVLALRAQDAEGQTDGQLLNQFLGQRDEQAFAVLVHRHAAMVLGVCRRVLGNTADAEDAFQATFLVLVRKAAALRARAALGDWLHGVARRTALKAKGAAAHRRTKEQAMARSEALGEEVRNDWLPLLDEELSKLPEKYRLPIVLCDLEGKTRKEAARRLGWPEGTVAGRLARGRTELSRRLIARGVILPAGALSALLPMNAALASVPPGLMSSTIKAAALVAAGNAGESVISAKVATLMGEIMKSMLLTKLKHVALLLAVCAFCGIGWVAYQSFAREPVGTIQAANTAKEKRADQEAEARSPADKEEAVVSRVFLEDASSRQLIANLRERLDMKNFQNPMPLLEFLVLVYDIHAARGKGEFGVVVDTEAFREENLESDVNQIQVKFSPLPRTMTTAQALKLAISQIPGDKAEMLVRDGLIYITTQKHASVAYLLQEKVCARFENRPLIDVVQNLADVTGASITLDPRALDKTKTPITVTFRNDVTLGGALRVIADMAGLKMVDMQSGLYMTTPANAKELEKELREVKKVGIESAGTSSPCSPCN